MRFLRRLLIGLFALLVLGSVVAVFLALDGAPRLPARTDVTPADIERAVTLARHHDPRRGPPGRTRWLMLTERDLDLLLRQALQRGLAGEPARSRVRLQPGLMSLEASLPAPAGLWLNLTLGLEQTATVPAVAQLRLGQLPLPPQLAMPLLRAAAARRGVQADALLALVDLERVVLLQGRVMASYKASPQALQQLRAAVMPAEAQQRLQAHAARLAELTRGWHGEVASIAELLQPLLQLAAQRSADGGDAAAEHRAALLAMALYALGPAVADWAPPQIRTPAARTLGVNLQMRPDLALHFIVSAVIAAESGTPLADAVGTWKELADARRGGSGFSFADLLADRAGTRFGAMAVRAPAQLQARTAAGLADGQLLPGIDGLPEQLPEDAYNARYGGPLGAGHQRLLAEIEARLDALPLYR